MKLQGQVAVITGAGRNIGKAMAKLFAAEGAKIAVIEMHEGRGQAVIAEITKAGQEAMLVAMQRRQIERRGSDGQQGRSALRRHRYSRQQRRSDGPREHL